VARSTKSPAGRRGVGRPPNKERWQKRREEVVDIAAHVFAERGYHRTTIDDLEEATGLTRGGLYHYMSGKHELLSQIHQRFIEPLLEEAERIAAEGRPPDETLRLLGEALMSDIAAYRDQVTVFLHEWRVIEHDPDWSDIRRARKRFEDVIDAVLRRGVREGYFEVADIRLTVLAFLGMINYSYQWYRPDGRVGAVKLADTFAEIFLDGIRPRPGSF
jgi:TetR/AcrR family transcriptional regulator, cholesterol catabolism regulator